MDLKEQIESFARSAFENGLNVEIDESLPSLAVYDDSDPDSGYFFQEHNAESMLSEMRDQAEEFDVSVKDLIAYHAQSW